MTAGLLDIVLFAALAAFVGYKLFSVLGRKDFDPDSDKIANLKRQNEATARQAEAKQQENAADRGAAPEKDYAFEPWMADQVEAIRRYDGNFTVTAFISGARRAFEIIVESFAKADKSTLKKLLSEDMYVNFSKVIDERQAANETHETTLISVLSAKIKDIIINNKQAEISIEFTSEQVNIVKDSTGKIIEGEASHIEKITEEWTFAKSLSSANPNWQLIATAA